MLEQIRLGAFISSLFYSVVGVLIFWFCFMLIDKLTPYHLWKELVDEHNVALAILLAGIALGICVIVASAIH